MLVMTDWKMSPTSKVVYVIICSYSVMLLKSPAVCAPAEYETNERGDSYDLDTEQSEARYDPRLLSEELRGSHSAPKQGAEDCISADRRYEHGQKITRLDPCEVCICVDGEVFCWWKQCEYPTKKPPKKAKYYSKNPFKSTNYTKSVKSNKRIPMNILNFPQNLPVHLPEFDLFSNNNSQRINTTSHHSTAATSTTTVTLATATASTTTGAVILSTSTTTAGANDPAIPENTSNINGPIVSSTNCCDSSGIAADGGVVSVNHQKTINGNPVNDKKTITQVNGDSNDDGNGNGFYEKTIINKDGVFIENVRTKVVSGTNTIPNTLSENNNNGSTLLNSNIDSMDDLPETRAKQIAMDESSLAKHYIITSSGNIENTPDVLASDSVMAQFRNNFNGEIPTNTLTSNNSDGQNGIEKLKPKAKISIPTELPVVTSTVEKIEQNCIVMGQSYKVGTVLPQETGNCLQCVCIESVQPDDQPRVTCSPHNCPPLILPDLFDTTGY